MFSLAAAHARHIRWRMLMMLLATFLNNRKKGLKEKKKTFFCVFFRLLFVAACCYCVISTYYQMHPTTTLIIIRLSYCNLVHRRGTSERPAATSACAFCLSLNWTHWTANCLHYTHLLAAASFLVLVTMMQPTVVLLTFTPFSLRFCLVLRAAIGFSAFHDLQVKSRNQLFFSLDEKNYQIKKKAKALRALKEIEVQKEGECGGCFCFWETFANEERVQHGRNNLIRRIRHSFQRPCFNDRTPFAPNEVNYNWASWVRRHNVESDRKKSSKNRRNQLEHEVDTN